MPVLPLDFSLILGYMPPGLPSGFSPWAYLFEYLFKMHLGQMPDGGDGVPQLHPTL
jgi:hypothetical protein